MKYDSGILLEIEDALIDFYHWRIMKATTQRMLLLGISLYDVYYSMPAKISMHNVIEFIALIVYAYDMNILCED